MRTIYLLSFLLVIFLTGCKKYGNDQRPNIVILFADDQRYQTINHLGNEEILTPHLDRLASSGVSFNNAYIMGGTSGAVCAPSRAMLLTGKTLFHLDQEGEWNFPVGSTDTTFIELLRRKGYFTYGVGKQHNGKGVVSRSFSDGGHFMFGGMSSHYKIPVFDFNADSLYSDENAYIVQDKHSTDLYADDAVNFIRDYHGEAPFLLYLAFQAPHDPREMPEDFLDIYENREIKLPLNFLPQHPFDNGELVIRDELLATFPRTGEEVINHIKAYYAMISHLDHAVGRILSAIDHKGIRNNTLIIFTADNGLAVGQHGLMGKQNLYEHSIRIPMIISGPGIPENRTSNAFCYLNDLYPTLCEYVGIKTPASVETSGFLKCLRDPDASHRELLTFAYKNFQRGIRKGPWKYIEYHVDGDNHIQLFNLDEDPWEMRDLAVFPGNQVLIGNLRGNMKNQWTSLGDTGFSWNVEPQNNTSHESHAIEQDR
ncbi:MAG: sulfatase-like hydrolase/transferase [Cyclobacteriaceae bacterium]|nr:sulfatase-like hydrolase/transferase [Cyclobacteriaceae bacterium]